MSAQDTTGRLGSTRERLAAWLRSWTIDWWLVAFIAIGFELRLATINTRGLWLDEALTVRQTTSSLSKIIATTVGGVHPPFFHILMHYWVTTFGTSEVTIRSFAMAFGVAAIPAAYWAGLRLYDRRVARLAAGMMAFWPYHIWYSQEARMYAMLMFFGLLSVGCLYVALEKDTFWHWVAYAVVTTLGAFAHYFFIFLVLGEAYYYVTYEVVIRGQVLKRRGERRMTWRRPWRVFSDVPTLAPWLISNTFLVVCFGAWSAYAVFFPPEDSALLGSVASSGLGYGQSGPSFAIRFNDVITMVVEAIAGFHPGPVMYALVAMWPLAIYALLLLFDLMGPMRRQTRLLVWSASGIPVVWLLGQWQGQVLASRYSMPLLAPALLLAAAVFAWAPGRTRRFLVVTSLLCALIAYADQSFNPDNSMRYDYRRAIQYVSSQYRPGDIIVYEPFYTDALFQYYMPSTLPAYGFPQYGHYGVVRDAKVQIGQDLSRITSGAKHVWLILSFQNIEKLRGDAYNTKMWFVRNGFRVGEDDQMNQVEVIRYDWAGEGTAGQPAVKTGPSATPKPSAASSSTAGGARR